MAFGRLLDLSLQKISQLYLTFREIIFYHRKQTQCKPQVFHSVFVDWSSARRRGVRSPSIPQLPQQRALYSYLSPYHAKLVGESFLGRKRPVYECTDMQEEFEEYAEKAKTLPESTTNESKLILYRLYKQANVGPVKANPFH